MSGTTHASISPYGLQVVVDPETAVTVTVDVIFVHGLTGNREETWTEKKSGCYWPRELLPQDVSSARVLAFGYDADIVRLLNTASSNTLRDHGNSLATTLAMHRTRTHSRHRPLIFVAHSLGGLICEQALLISRGSTEAHVSALLESTYGIAFMGTPHVGSDLAVWGKLLTDMAKLVKTANSAIVRVLEPGSEVLANLQQEFHMMIQQRRQKGCRELKIMCFYEELAMSTVGMIVPRHSAILSGYPKQSIHADHSAMTKFNNRSDPGYKAVSDQLWLWAEEISQAESLSHADTGRGQQQQQQQRQAHVSYFLGPASTSGGALIMGDQIAERDLNMRF